MCYGQFQHNPQHPVDVIHIYNGTTEVYLEYY